MQINSYIEMKTRVGILYVCTGKYAIFWKRFYKSCERYFMNDKDVERRYYIFTDSKSVYKSKRNSRIVIVPQENLGWPNNTLKRFHMFTGIKDRLMAETDYLFFFNANMEFCSNIGTEVLPPDDGNRLIGSIHPGFYDLEKAEFTYERRKESTAYIPLEDGEHYYSGALSGGATKEYLKLCEILRERTDIDEANGIVALWHDESQINRYFLENPPSKELSPAYVYPEGWSLPYSPCVIMLDKASKRYGGHEYMRSKEGQGQSVWKRLKCKLGI